MAGELTLLVAVIVTNVRIEVDLGLFVDLLRHLEGIFSATPFLITLELILKEPIEFVHFLLVLIYILN